MDPLSALAEIVKAVAWPVSVFAIVLLFRKAIEGFVGSIREGTFKYKDVEASVKRDLSDARALAPPDTKELREIATPKREFDPTSSLLDEAMLLAESDPRSAILMSWGRLMAVVRAAVGRLAPARIRAEDFASGNYDSQLGQFYPATVISAIGRLRQVRNSLAQNPGFQPNVSDAKEFLLLAEGIVADLDKGGKEK